ncbi:hypothetical protein D3C76_1141570 [compost metagenome]
MVWPDRLAGRQGKPLVLGHGVCRPGFAHAETIDAAGLDMRGHLGGWHYHAVDIVQWMNTLARQPVIQPHGMSAGGECLGERQPCAMLVHTARQCLRAGHACALQGRGQVDGLGILIQAHEHRHVAAGHATDAQVHGVDKSIQAVCGIQFATHQLVAQTGPGPLALEVEGQAMLLGEALGGGDYHRGAVGQGHEADVQTGFLRRIAAVDPGQGHCRGCCIHKVPRPYRTGCLQ